MWKTLFVLFGIFDLVLGIVFLVGMSIDSPLRPILSAPFCNGEVLVRSYYESDEFYCLEGDIERDITPQVVIIGIAGIGGGIMIILFGVFVGTFISMSRQSRILKSGEPAKARILDIKTTGITINNSPLYDIVLEVLPDFQQPYEATARIRISPFDIPYLQRGAEIPVMVDRKNPQHVAIDLGMLSDIGLSAMPMKNKMDSGSDNLTVKLRQLEESLRAGLITQQEYDDLRQRVLDELV